VTGKRAPRTPPEPPEHVSDAVAEVWREVVEANGIVGAIDRAALEAYCTATVRMRDAAKRIADEGLVVQVGGRTIVHPALAVERDAATQLVALGTRFKPVTPPRRRPGPMYDATRKSFAAAAHLQGKDEFEGPREAVLTLAWLIDEAQRAGIDALQKATYNLIPSYIKACAELQITPASLPPEAAAPKKTSKLAVLRGGGADGDGAATG